MTTEYAVKTVTPAFNGAARSAALIQFPIDPKAIDEYVKIIVPVISESIIERGVEAFEEFMLALPQAETPVIHHYAPGQYIREVRLDAGLVAMGNYQKTEHLNVMLSGRVAMIDERGAMFDLQGPTMFVGKPGRKIGYIRETTAWLNIYVTDEQDIETLEAMLLDKTIGAKAAVSSDRSNRNASAERIDYTEVLALFNFTEDQAREMSERTEDMRPLPWGAYKIKVADSPINGRGLFATAAIAEGEVIALALIGRQRTIAGRFTNHSKTPNAKFVKHPNDDLTLVALRSIGGCNGGFDGEEITIDYREALGMAFPDRRTK